MAFGADRPRLLMCEPAGFGVHHLLNPWMAWSEEVDGRRASRQWTELQDALIAAGAPVEVMANTSRSGAMTFTRDTAVVTAHRRAVVVRNFGRRGDLEPDVVARWLRSDGFATDELPEHLRFDGGNVRARPGP